MTIFRDDDFDDEIDVRSLPSIIHKADAYQEMQKSNVNVLLKTKKNSLGGLIISKNKA